jgi:hypothetical protein
MDYNPRANKVMLARAWEHIQSVPYQVSLRWLFYRLLQDGICKGKADYKRFKKPIGNARKNFYEGWRPWTLVDDTRRSHRDWHGYLTVEEWKREIRSHGCVLDPWPEQERYGIIAFEADAMFRQFEHYAPGAFSLWPFRGDASLEYKYRLAKHIEKAATTYSNPVTVFYFGDLDPKGQSIPENAMRDVKAWCEVDFEFVRGGLNRGDETRFGIPENFENPGEYQWEALTDEGARTLIAETLEGFYDRYADLIISKRENEATQALRDALDGIKDQ